MTNQPSWCEDSVTKRDIQILISQGEAITTERRYVERTQDTLNAGEATFKQKNALLDNDTKKYVRDVEKYNADSNNYKVAVTQHNARCSGQPPDASFIAECNAKASQLDEWSARLNKESADLRQQQKELKDRIAELDTATKKDENLKEVSIKQQAWLSQVRAFLSTPATKNLVRKAGVTQACAKINEKEKSESALKKISEKAIQCLQKLYGSIY
jgi:uncharacterized phage infection (PIP) family protein YhgE